MAEYRSIRASQHSRALSRGRIQKLTVGERGHLLGHLLRLSEADRRRRFCAPVSDSHIEKYCLPDPTRHRVVFGYWLDGTLRGAGEMVYLEQPCYGGTAELALSVEGPYQNGGIGTELSRRLLITARNRGIRMVTITSQQDNIPMRSLARKFNAEFHYSRGELEVCIRPPRANHFTFADEWWNDSYGLWQRLLMPAGRKVVEGHGECELSELQDVCG